MKDVKVYLTYEPMFTSIFCKYLIDSFVSAMFPFDNTRNEQ